MMYAYHFTTWDSVGPAAGAVSWHALQDQKNPAIINYVLTHTYIGAGHYGHISEPIELLITPVTPDKIHLAGDWNLLHLVRGLKSRKLIAI